MKSLTELRLASNSANSGALKSPHLPGSTRLGGFYLVPSQPHPPHRNTRCVRVKSPTCTCPDHETRGCRCKHIYAVEYFDSAGKQRGWIDHRYRTSHRHQNPQDVSAELASIQSRRRPYEKAASFKPLLADLCRDIKARRDKPDAASGVCPLSDAVFCAVFKIYSTISARRFTSDLCDAQDQGIHRQGSALQFGAELIWRIPNCIRSFWS